MSYKIKLFNGTEVHRHVDSIKRRDSSLVATEVTHDFEVATEATPDFEGPTVESTDHKNTQSQLISSTPRVSETPEQSELLTGL